MFKLFSQSFRAVSLPHLTLRAVSRPFCSATKAITDTKSTPPARICLPVEDESGEELVPERLYSMINIKVQGFEFAVLESYIKFVTTACEALGIKNGGRVALPTEFQKFTVLKSAHIFKKHRVQYEIRTYSRLVQIRQITGTTADVFLEYIQRNLPEGVTMTIYQEELRALPKLLMSQYEVEKPPQVRSKKKK
ncbi:PREDICTED: 28S ribosomal protein S10, mitochondrial-like [Amphimedon queenslandica]|uniref:Small ribosomal subunit protein uS10m n=1 Tax=Amphimedon queenslandica TaxID=400682 RepID=A0A1X7VH60_AMPQE|nr:PREDICTED: 28S ribosomal protein S10, mitochondrial-like [Amphimedon queenslandica]|eukprot:XP_011410379.1 PREDICTED: 28S ribosomal protein S10, mitochondrial-like [Amphimedon queenslandica]